MFTRGVTSTIWIRLLDHMHSGASSARRKKILERQNSEERNPNPKFSTSSHFKAASYHLNLGCLRPGNLRPNWASALCKRLFLLHDYYIMCPECQPRSIYQPIKDKIVHWSHLKKKKKAHVTWTGSKRNNNNDLDIINPDIFTGLIYLPSRCVSVHNKWNMSCFWFDYGLLQQTGCTRCSDDLGHKQKSYYRVINLSVEETATSPLPRPPLIMRLGCGEFKEVNNDMIFFFY